MLPIKIGAAQLSDIQNNTDATLNVICRQLTLAEDEKLDVLCFPECYLQGYTLDAAQTKERAIDLASPQFQKILDRLSKYKTAMIIGLIEKEGDHFYNTAVVVYSGRLLGKYRKVHLFETNFEAGHEYPIFTVNGLTFGINICYDARFSEGAAALVKLGAQVIFYPLNNRLQIEKATKYHDKHLPNLIDRAQETGCWTVSSDVIGQDNETIAYGFSAMVDPSGNIVNRVTELKVGIVSTAIGSQH